MGFQEVFDNLMKVEGSYSNNPLDKGGETYKGISRKNYPNWDGWVIIDEYKRAELKFPTILEYSSKLNELVKGFYKESYWNKIKGDEINPKLAEELFDTSVNMGLGTGVKFLQHALNVLNRDESLYSDIKEDGGFGNATLAALDSYLSIDKVELLIKIMNILQGYRYIQIMDIYPEQEAFARGWLNDRVRFNK